MIVTVPQHQFLWSALDEYSHHRRRYGRQDLVDKIARAGYTVQRATSFMTLTLPAQVASRFRLQRIETLNPAAEMALNPIVMPSCARFAQSNAVRSCPACRSPREVRC